MNKPVVFTLVGVAVLIVAAGAYVFFAPTASTPTSEVSPETTKPVTPNTTAGAYIDYSEPAVAEARGTKLLFFHASWCPQCKAVDESIKTDGVPENVTIFKVDYDTNQDLRAKYGVTLQTTFVKIDESGNKIASYVAYNEPTIEAVSRELLQ